MILAPATAFYLVCCSLPATGIEHDPFGHAVQVLRFSFENDEERLYDGDRDYDGLPDDWTRRKGLGFPTYVRAAIDSDQGRHGTHSLRFKVNGGAASLYSPVTQEVGRIDRLFAYVFQGYVRTQLLEHDAAVFSISFLNQKRQRIQRFLTQPVTGTHRDWVCLRAGPMTPHEDARYVAIGCHLVQSKGRDVRGSVWFDDLWLGRLPRLSLATNFAAHFKERDQPIQITAKVSGLDSTATSQLEMVLVDNSAGSDNSDNSDGTLKRETRKLTIPKTAADVDAARASSTPISETWELPLQQPGFYTVRAELIRDGTAIRTEQTTFAVMDLVDRNRPGEFGWSIGKMPKDLQIEALGDLAFQSGINWLKYPLWGIDPSKDPQRCSDISLLFEWLDRRQITPVGLLDNPPPQVRDKFSRDWSGVSEVFSMPSTFWYPSLEPVVTRFASNVWHWQVGSESDASFIGMKKLAETIGPIKRQLDGGGRDTHVGLHWNWNAPIPTKAELPGAFLSINSPEPLSGPELAEKLKESAASGLPCWVLLKPLAKSQFSAEERATNLMKRMVAAKTGGAEAIFAWNVFDKEYGLLNDDGSPDTLFLPWRTTALTLQGTEYLGSFRLPGRSTNHVFARDDEVVIVIWNDEPHTEEDEPHTEELYLGENVVVTDLWGRQSRARVEANPKRQIIEVGPLPVIIRGCSAPVARWRLAVQFEKGKIRSEYGGHEDAIRAVNTFRQGINATATLNVPHDWKVEPKTWSISAAAGESLRLPMLLELPPDASLGQEEWDIDFEIAADRPYRFKVYRPYQVGIGDILITVVGRKHEDGRLEIEQVITNNTTPTEVLDFRCSLSMEGHRRQKQFVTKLGDDEDRKLYYFPDAESLRGKKVWLRAEQVNGRRVLNKKLAIGETW